MLYIAAHICQSVLLLPELLLAAHRAFRYDNQKFFHFVLGLFPGIITRPIPGSPYTMASTSHALRHLSRRCPATRGAVLFYNAHPPQES